MKKIVVKKEQNPFEIMSTMGCRTQNGADINAKESYSENIKNVIFNGKITNNVYSAAQKDGRGNICPVTIILPTLAMEAKDFVNCHFDYPNSKEYVKCFMHKLDEAINDAKDMLIERFEYICNQNPDSAKFMYENGTMAGYIPEDGIRSALRHGTLAVG